MRSRIRPLVVAVAAITLVAGCASKAPSSSGGGSGGKGQFVVGYSQSNNAEPYRAQLNLQLQYFMKQHPDLKLLPITDAHQSSATQVSQVQNFIQQKVNVLIVSPNEPAPLTAAVQQACQAKIPVIILDRSINTNCYSSFIGGDNYTIGKLAGQEAVKDLPNGGNIVELRGIMSDQPQIDRDRGFRDAIKANPKLKIIADREAKWLKDSAVSITQQWLSRYPKIDLVYGQNDPMTLGAYLAAKAQHREGAMKFVGTDGLAIPDGGIRAVQLGELTSTFVYPTCAKQAADTAEALVHNKPVSKKQTLGTVQVTKANAAQLYKQYDMSGKIGG